MGSGGNKDPKPAAPTESIATLKHASIWEDIANQKASEMWAFEHDKGPKDILNAPGIGEVADIYGTAQSLEAQDRVGSPQVALSGGGSGDYAAQLEGQHKQQRYDTRAQGINQGYHDLKDQAYGMGQSAASLGLQRSQAAAGIESGNYNEWQRRQAAKVPLWQQIAGIAVGGASALLGSGGIRGNK